MISLFPGLKLCYTFHESLNKACFGWSCLGGSLHLMQLSEDRIHPANRAWLFAGCCRKPSRKDDDTL